MLCHAMPCHDLLCFATVLVRKQAAIGETTAVRLVLLYSLSQNHEFWRRIMSFVKVDVFTENFIGHLKDVLWTATSFRRGLALVPVPVL